MSVAAVNNPLKELRNVGRLSVNVCFGSVTNSKLWIGSRIAYYP